MEKLSWWTARVLLCPFFALLVWLLPAFGAEQAKQEVTTPKGGKIPVEYAITITGRVLSEEKTPLVVMSILVSETDPENIGITWQTGDDGKLLNPTANTDASGRFMIHADRRFWGKTGYFTLQGGFIPGTMRNAGILCGPGGSPIVIKTDPKTKKIDLGDIIVSRS